VVAAVKRRTDKHVVCSKTIVATPETAEKVVELCKGMMEFSQRRAAESDSGILAFDVSQDIYDGNVVHFWERYESNAHMGRHNTSPEFTKFMQDVRPPLPTCTVLPRNAPTAVLLRFWQPLNCHGRSHHTASYSTTLRALWPET
jgi:quinol monooxygenase YgiN